MWTIRALARRHGLSRTTLLYYDRIGLLRPATRGANGYRLYSTEDGERLAQICRFRAAGLPLARIRALQGGAGGAVAEALERRLDELNRELAALRRQQQVVVELLARASARRSSRILTKTAWVRLLARAGLDEEGRDRWHREFERLAPEAHQDFLESLGLAPEQIAYVRRNAGALTPGIRDTPHTRRRPRPPGAARSPAR